MLSRCTVTARSRERRGCSLFLVPVLDALWYQISRFPLNRDLKQGDTKSEHVRCCGQCMRDNGSAEPEIADDCLVIAIDQHGSKAKIAVNQVAIVDVRECARNVKGPTQQKSA